MTAIDARVEPASLVARIGQGDRDAEQALVARYSRGLMLMLRRRTGNVQHAEDLHQEAFRIVIERLRTRSLDNPAKLNGFIHRVGVNLYIDNTRKSIRRRTDANQDAVVSAPDEHAGQLHQLIENEAGACVRRMLDELKMPRDREILRRFYILDQDKSVICQTLDLDKFQFDHVISRARMRFRHLLESRPELDDVIGGQR